MQLDMTKALETAVCELKKARYTAIGALWVLLITIIAPLVQIVITAWGRPIETPLMVFGARPVMHLLGLAIFYAGVLVLSIAWQARIYDTMTSRTEALQRLLYPLHEAGGKKLVYMHDAATYWQDEHYTRVWTTAAEEAAFSARTDCSYTNIWLAAMVSASALTMLSFACFIMFFSRTINWEYWISWAF